MHHEEFTHNHIYTQIAHSTKSNAAEFNKLLGMRSSSVMASELI